MKTNKKGISLIVLIITILVMIIIAAAVILYLDDSKVMKNAKKAVTANNVSVAREVMVVAKAEWNSNKNKLIEEGYYSFDKFAKYKLEEAGFEIGDNGGQVDVSPSGLLYTYVEPIIPEGYIASDKDGEDEVKEGLVIYEGDETVSTDEDAMETRNQFVWVPVPNMSEFVRKEWGKGIAISETTSYDLTSTEEAAEYNAMKESVAKYGGFYIARYEAGKGTDDNLEIKKGISYPWQFVKLDVAKSQCETLSTSSVKGHLIYGEEWDAALNFISKTDPDYATKSNATGKGNYTKTLIKLGINDEYKLNNIYDMAGNVRELTMEFSEEDGRIFRGGGNDSFITTVSTRDKYYSSYSAEDGFRPALYLK